MKFVVLSRRQAGKRKPDEPHVIISITNPGKPEAELAFSYLRLDVLRLSFSHMENYGNIKSFRVNHAQEILEFVNKYRFKVSVIVVQCETGLFASVSIANILRRLLVDDIFLRDDDYYVDSFMQKIFLEEAQHQHWPRGAALIGETTSPVEPISLGRSGVSVARFLTGHGRFIRKSGNIELLEREARVLVALSGITTLSPEFVGRDGGAFFQTELSGIPLSDAIHTAPEKIAALFGETLKGVHALQPSLAPDPRDDWTRLQRNEGIEPLPALFSHGDWCLPNVLTDGDKITGIVDWADGGWRDPRIDLGTGIWTLRYNLGGPSPAVEAAFLAGYEFAGSSEELEPFVALYEGN